MIVSNTPVVGPGSATENNKKIWIPRESSVANCMELNNNNNIFYFLQDLRSIQIKHTTIHYVNKQFNYNMKEEIMYVTHIYTWDDFITHDKFCVSKDDSH